MTLHEAQVLFLRLIAQLIDRSSQMGCELTAGEFYRTPEQAALNAARGTGIKDSLHCQRLACDLNLFVDGLYQTDTAAYRALGEYWQSLHPLCTWGGSFHSRPDGNHFEFSWSPRIQPTS